MKKQLDYKNIIKETVILTWAVAIIAAAVYFFLSWNCAVQLCSPALVCHHHDPERGAPDHRIFYLRKGIWSKDRLYKHCFAAVYRSF